MQDAVGDVEDAVVVGDEQDRRAALAGQRLHAIDHFAARGLVEGRGRLVRQHHRRFPDERPRDRHALALAAGQLVRPLAGVLAEADGFEHRVGLARQVGARGPPRHAQAQLHVLRGAERAEQVVLLEDEADALPDVLERRAPGAVEPVAEHAQRAFLRRPQGANQREQRGLARTRRARDDHDLACRDRGRHVEQDLAAQRALAIVVAEVFDDDRCSVHAQNTSAGSSRRTLRSAR